MCFEIARTNSACGAVVTHIDLSKGIADPVVSQLRQEWLKHKVLVFPNQLLSNDDLERFTSYFGEFGEDPFFGHIDGHPHIAAISRSADETTSIFAEFFHSDWSFLEVPPAGTILYGITIPPVGGNTLFANQVLAYQRLSAEKKELADSLMAIHTAEKGYAPDGVYGDDDQDRGRSMDIISNDMARDRRHHPFVRTHPETGEKALFSSPAYIEGFVGKSEAENIKLLMEFYSEQTADEVVYSHQWQANMLVMWDNRSVLHAATGGYDGYERLLHRTTIADETF